MLLVGVALADDQTTVGEDVLAVSRVGVVDGAGDTGELTLLLGDGAALEDAVVTAADSGELVAREVGVLRDGEQICEDVLAGDALHDGTDLLHGEGDGGLCDDLAVAVSEQDFHGNAGIFLLCVGVVNDSTCDAVGELVRMGGVYFFKHCSYWLRLSLSLIYFTALSD